MNEEERKAGLKKATRGLVGDLLKIAGSLIVIWIIWQAYF